MIKHEIFAGLVLVFVLVLLCAVVSFLAGGRPLASAGYLFSDPWYPIHLK